MSSKSQVGIDYDREIEIIDHALLACKRDFEELLYKRHVFIARKFNIDILELIDYLAMDGGVAKESVDMLISIVNRKREKPTKRARTFGQK